jgi:hypothetical protein
MHSGQCLYKGTPLITPRESIDGTLYRESYILLTINDKDKAGSCSDCVGSRGRSGFLIEPQEEGTQPSSLPLSPPPASSQKLC